MTLKYKLYIWIIVSILIQIIFLYHNICQDLKVGLHSVSHLLTTVNILHKISIMFQVGYIILHSLFNEEKHRLYESFLSWFFVPIIYLLIKVSYYIFSFIALAVIGEIKNNTYVKQLHIKQPLNNVLSKSESSVKQSTIILEQQDRKPEKKKELTTKHSIFDD